MITPSDTPSSPERYAEVAVSGFGILDGQAAAEAEITDAMDAANAVAGAGALYPQGPRQAAAERLLGSAQGYSDFDITAGFSGSGEDSWPNDPTPGG